LINFANSEPVNFNRFGGGISRNSSSKDMSGFIGESDCSNKENPLDKKRFEFTNNNTSFTSDLSQITNSMG